jgi:Raf kinase inhibitor-like YbhB/YbcL family protein
MSLRLSSSAFEPGGAIPAKYTCQGDNVSLPLHWEGAPAGTKSLALIVDDPTAPREPCSHWVLYNIPPGLDHLEENFSDGRHAQGGVPGRNDFGGVGYGGPCPPQGPAHRYVFRLFALDKSLDLTPGAIHAQLFDFMQGHILAETELVGTYASG